MKKPYRGEEPYLFLSYAHKDLQAVQEIIETLQEKGYRIWYDEGIDPGTEWDEMVAAHVEQCDYFVALLSEQYLESDNCKDELNFARDLNKPRLLVYLEDVQLPSGLRMRLSRLQAIHKYRYAQLDVFFEKFAETYNIDVCRKDSKVVPTFREKTKPVEPASIPFVSTKPGFARGTCGPKIQWFLDTSNTMTVWGTGPIPDNDNLGKYNDELLPEWRRDPFMRKMHRVSIQAGITRIGEEAFQLCEFLETIEFSDTVREIGRSSFLACYCLESLFIPDSVERIEACAFAGCSCLKKARLSTQLTVIEKATFALCDSLESVEIPLSVQKIKEEAFQGCTSLTMVRIPQNCIVEPNAFPNSVILERV